MVKWYPVVLLETPHFQLEARGSSPCFPRALVRVAMVFPVGGLATPGLGSYGPPPEEVLRILPALKACVVAVALMVIGEFVATYYQEAISELLTPLFGLIALRDPTQTGQCILCLAVVSGFNCISDIVSIVLILSGERYISGARAFFSTECEGMVRYYDPTTRSVKEKQEELCSWQTVLGNCVLILAVLLEFACCRWSIKAFRVYQNDGMNAMDAMLGAPDGERVDNAAYPPGHGTDRAERPEGPGTAARSQGFVPFSGQGQRLSWGIWSS